MNQELLNPPVTAASLFPPHLHIIPLRYRPVFPGLITPLIIPTGGFVEALEPIIDTGVYLGLIMQIDEKKDEFDIKNLYQTGTIVKPLKKVRLPDGSLNLMVNSLSRFSVKKFFLQKKTILAEIAKYHVDKNEPKSKEIQALTREILIMAKELSGYNPFFTEEMKLILVNVDEPGKIADFIVSILNLKKQEFQDALESFDIKERLVHTLYYLSKEIELIRIQKKIHDQVQSKIEHQQRQFLLKEQLRSIQNELKEKSSLSDSEIFLEKLAQLPISQEQKEKIRKEIEKLEYTEAHSSEYSVIRNYLEMIFDLPWQEPAIQKIDLHKSKKILDKAHYKIEDVKRRIIELLAVLNLRPKARGFIICLVGPPGVGKTSLGRSIAKTLATKYFRISLGGMRDEAEIKGHRRTYVGAMPGKIIQALKDTRVKNPLILLDEIDKMSASYNSDPASALLEVLDPEQNFNFRDHYLDLPFDLSQVYFVVTANSTENLPEALLDRMEIIQLSGYILEEKLQILKKHIIPRTLFEHGLENYQKQIHFNDKVLEKLISSYSREAGVRSLEKTMDKIMRQLAVKIVNKEKIPPLDKIETLMQILGKVKFNTEKNTVAAQIGQVTGLAYTQYGGSTILIEAIKTSGSNQIKTTGRLGEVMKESAQIAFSYIQSLPQYNNEWQKFDIHLHVPDGATPKDGPSAGVSIATSLFSLLLTRPPKAGFAMTGEITLSGRITKIGGLKEKLIAAKRVGIKKIIIPYENSDDLEEIPKIIRKNLQIFPVVHFDNVISLVFGKL